MGKILIIDDDPSIRKYLTRVLEESSHDITSSSRLADGVEKCDQEEFDIVLLDVQLPDGNGLKALPKIQNSQGRPEVIIITGAGDPDGAELAIKSGAWDYIEKPLLIESILLPVGRALLYHAEKQSAALLGSFDRHNIIGNSPQINDSILVASRAAKSESSTFITGETGTGKELFARAIHQNSFRRQNNFVVVDCTALPKTLVESILFGHEKGSFTGADQRREGLVELAHRGTLFLDEIGELPLSTQKTFLRVLQEKRFRSVGGKNEKESDFRLIAATNRDLDILEKKGMFRKDLLFRLRNINLELPPLRKRDGDIQLLAPYFVNQICKLNELPNKQISDELLAALKSYNWPGNVREFVSVLENVVSTARSNSILYPDHLPVEIRATIVKFSIKPKEKEGINSEFIQDDSGVTLDSFKQYRENIVLEAEKRYLSDLVSNTAWNIQEACRVSKLSRPRLYALLKKHDISRSSI